jgi:glucose-6-phosphate 1-dehydrogenase
MQKAEPVIIVIFGGSGDLTYRKIIPALYALHMKGLLSDGLAIIGTGRSEFTLDAYRKKALEGITKYSEQNDIDQNLLKDFSSHISYLQMDSTEPEEFTKLSSKILDIRKRKHIPANFLFYLATPPSLFKPIAENLSAAGLTNESSGFSRLIIEKPFGYDLESSISLNADLHRVLKEKQIYRIDHYLGKETVQNLLVTRFANGIFEPLWNRNFIQHIEITAAESLGVENRGGYYDKSGALRDMVQNHLLQMVGLTAMEPPSAMDADAIRNEVFKVMQALRPIYIEDVGKQVIRGQYLTSHIRGEKALAYREEKDVTNDSKTETYVAMKFFIDNWRWGGVPFYIRTGKRLPTRVTEIVIHFKPTPHQLFRQDEICQTGNQLVIRIQPDEGILLKFGMKLPGAGFTVKQANMDFHYSDLNQTSVPLAYERLLLDALNGDATLYARADTVEAAWAFVHPIQRAWEDKPDIPIYGYPAGTWGPDHADTLIEGDIQTWRYPCKNLADDGEYCEL